MSTDTTLHFFGAITLVLDASLTQLVTTAKETFELMKFRVILAY